MADSSIPNLTEKTTLASTDLFVIVDMSGSPTDKKLTTTHAKDYFNGLDLGNLAADPSTGGLAEGSRWYNTTGHNWTGWNGTEIVILG